MPRILVVGSSCAGKTTLAAAAARTGLRHVELDAHHWGPDWSERPDAAMRATVDAATRGDGWIADGNYAGVREVLWPRADTIVWLDYGFVRVFGRALRRTLGRAIFRRRLFAGNRESLRRSFLSRDSILLWVIRTHGDRHRRYGRLLGSGPDRSEHLAPDVVVHRCRRPAEAAAWLARLEAGNASGVGPDAAASDAPVAAAPAGNAPALAPTPAPAPAPAAGTASASAPAASHDPHAGRRRCLTCDYVLDGLAAAVCPECGRAFDPDDATTYLATLPDRVVLVRTTVLAAHVLEFSLRAEGIDTVLEEDPNPLLGASATVWVAGEDAGRAAEVLARTVRSRPPGSSADESAAPSGDAWSCPGCRERIEPAFSGCWNCGAERPPA